MRRAPAGAAGAAGRRPRGGVGRRRGGAGAAARAGTCGPDADVTVTYRRRGGNRPKGDRRSPSTGACGAAVHALWAGPSAKRTPDGAGSWFRPRSAPSDQHLIARRL
ncbi:hypothetical protein GCM10010358_13770 [Streptomyces minutiscleroticus]|uniref:Uncharacterized protein n=1 Tax=Streptomyces minutiscleroticus TaxID=68238 RepID=A0A918KGW8_9ACTN|nr:hypothetical protein GCM10010358_13770 [Streptomyces minutiscleroticus]